MFFSFLNAQGYTAPPTPYVFLNAGMQTIAKPESKPGWIYFKDNFSTPVEDVFTTHASAFGLGVDDSLGVVNDWVDELGWRRVRFIQFYKSVKVYGS